MRPLTLPGTLTDAAGTVAVAWQVSPLVGPGGERSYAVSGVVRGVERSGPGFEALGLVDCVITATLPALVTSDAGTVPEPLVMRMTITRYAECAVEVGGSSKGEGVAGPSAGRASLAEALAALDAGRPGRYLRGCATCRLAGPAPDGPRVMGLACYRDAAAAYLVGSAPERAAVPVTEVVPDFWWCDDYEGVLR